MGTRREKKCNQTRISFRFNGIYVHMKKKSYSTTRISNPSALNSTPFLYIYNFIPIFLFSIILNADRKTPTVSYTAVQDNDDNAVKEIS